MLSHIVRTNFTWSLIPNCNLRQIISEFTCLISYIEVKVGKLWGFEGSHLRSLISYIEVRHFMRLYIERRHQAEAKPIANCSGTKVATAVCHQQELHSNLLEWPLGVDMEERRKKCSQEQGSPWLGLSPEKEEDKFVEARVCACMEPNQIKVFICFQLPGRFTSGS
jgi:hypothetical protein